MKKFVTLVLVFAMLLSLVAIPSNASGSIPALNCTEVSNGVSKTDDGIYLSARYSYAGYGEIDLTGIQSVEITATHQFTLTHEGEVFWIRVDEPKGPVIGTVYMEKDTAGKPEVFKGSIDVPQTGKHKVYLTSLYGSSMQSSKIMSINFSKAVYNAPTYVPTPDSAVVDDNHTTWALTDILGRKAATYAEAGPVREGKYAGIFYHIWHWGRHNALNYTDFMAKYPEAKHDYYHEAWPTVTTSHFWNTPVFGYYSNTDYWVYRKHAAMLAAAGIDFVTFDCSNAGVSMRQGYDTFLRAMDDAKREGLDTPKIVFMNSIRAELENEKLKDTRVYLDLYKRGKYSDHWFYWEGKPLILTYTDGLVGESGDAEDAKLMEEIKNFFTIRNIATVSYDKPPSNDHEWAWLSVYPQYPYGKNPDGSWEMMVVASAANYSYKTKSISAMNSPYATGRSYTDLLGEDKSDKAYLNGYFFQEECKRLMEVDPEIMFITGWNEWIAGRSKAGSETLNAIVDTFDNEHSRDFEPTSGAGGMKDVYYCLMVDAIRKFKGVEETPLASAPKTIDINNLGSWSGVGPAFYNAKGTYDRDYMGYNNTNNKNFTARNNVVKSLVARDNANLYFYAECHKAITAPEGNKWMKLYINADRNFATGWEGYDYVINYPNAGAVSSLNMDGSYNLLGSAEYVINNNVLTLKVARNLVGVTGMVDFEFKWVDNADGEVLNFYVDGNAAPLGRFNYVYTEIPEVYASEALKALLNDVHVVAANSPYVYKEGKKSYVYEPDIRFTTIDYNGVTYIPTHFLFEAIEYRTNYDAGRGMLKLLGAKEMYVTIGELSARLNGVKVAISNPAIVVEGVPYIPVTMLSEVFGYEVYVGADRVAFGHGINQAAVNQLVF